MTEAPAWLRREIKDGLKALVALNPDGTPASEILTKTADVWLIAVQRGGVGCNIESIDAPRIREGFLRLFPTLRKWPVPAQLIEQIPGRPEREKLPEPPISETDRDEGQRKFDELKKHLATGATLPPAPVAPETEPRRKQLREQARTLGEN